MECLASFAHPSPFFVSGRAATESWRRNKTVSMAALSRKATDLFFFAEGRTKKNCNLLSVATQRWFCCSIPQFSRWCHYVCAPLPELLQARGQTLGGGTAWGPGTGAHHPLSLPNVAGGAHAWCLDTFRIGEEGMGLDALCGYTAEDSHTGSQNTTT